LTVYDRDNDEVGIAEPWLENIEIIQKEEIK